MNRLKTWAAGESYSDRRIIRLAIVISFLDQAQLRPFQAERPGPINGVLLRWTLPFLGDCWMVLESAPMRDPRPPIRTMSGSRRFQPAGMRNSACHCPTLERRTLV